MALLCSLPSSHSSATNSVPIEPLGPWHVHYVDQQKTSKGKVNYLFRGGNPDISKDVTLQFGSLVKQIQFAATTSKVKLPSDVYVIIINLLNLDAKLVGGKVDPVGFDMMHFLAEVEYFEKHPSEGELIFWETLGTWDNSTLMQKKSQAVHNYLVRTLPQWQGDNMVGRMEALMKILQTDYGKPAVIYGHCNCGCDRTGQFFGSYYMRWLNMTWENVNALNTKIATRPMWCQNYLNMQWYCWWLRQTQGYAHLDCQKNFQCSHPEALHPAVEEY
jgi:hypothetical protein